MNRSYRFRLYPSRTQEHALLVQLDLLRELYNAALQERRDAWVKSRTSVSLYDQCGVLPEVRAFRSEFAAVSITAMRGTLRTLDEAFRAFFRRCKSSEKPGYPRFRGKHRFSTIALDDLGKRSPVVAGGKRVAVPLLGKVKFKQHRSINGTPKSLRITHDHGRWFVVFQCVDVPRKPLPATPSDVGIDLGLCTLIATSDGELLTNPRALKTSRLELARAQRRVSRRKRGSKRRRKAVVILARKHARVANIRRESAITVARHLVAKHGTVYREELNIRGLARSGLAGSVRDAGWGEICRWLDVKAEEAGRQVVLVDPRGTSQECSECGVVVPKNLGERMHRCHGCGYVADRDVNAARNILLRGRRSRGEALDCETSEIREVSIRDAGVGTCVSN